MKSPGFGFEAYLGFLCSLHKSGASFFVEGGQAVNFWAEYIDARIEARPLSSMRPFTSKDCDIWVSHRTWNDLKQNAGENLLVGTSPTDGQLGILTLSENPPLAVDMMSNVYGIPVEENLRILERALDDGIVRVIDPLYLFRSKCHCFQHLDQTGRQDERHVRMLALVLPEYFSLLVQNVDEGALDERALLKELKFLRTILSSGVCRRALDRLSIESDALIPWESLAKSSSERLVKYVQTQRKNGNR